MDPNWRHPYGLRPTIRHLMLLVLDIALLSALARLLGGGIHGGLFILLALSPPLLSVLILVFERPSPAKYWLVGLVISPFIAFLAVAFDVLAAAFWWYVQESRGIMFFLLLTNVTGVVSLILTARRLPRRCPECGLRAWLPLGRRSAPLFWCASCGFGERVGRSHATH